jgi:hypothetical protein
LPIAAAGGFCFIQLVEEVNVFFVFSGGHTCLLPDADPVTRKFQLKVELKPITSINWVANDHDQECEAGREHKGAQSPFIRASQTRSEPTNFFNSGPWEYSENHPWHGPGFLRPFNGYPSAFLLSWII